LLPQYTQMGFISFSMMFAGTYMGKLNVGVDVPRYLPRNKR
jgi:hypothetical protein